MPQQPVRVIVRLPYNRPEHPEERLPDPPRVEWNQDKEAILWEVIAKSRAIEGASTDWKGLAAHLQVPLPYLLYRAQLRYEEGIRGLQGIRSSLSPAIPNAAPAAFPSNPSLSPVTTVPTNSNANEYFPRLPELTSRRISNSPVIPTRPLGVRARLSSLGQQSQRSRRGSVIRYSSSRSNQSGSANANTITNGLARPRSTNKVSSSSVITLQGPHRSRGTPPPPMSHAASERDSDANRLAGDEEESEDSDEEDARKEEEENRQAEEQQALERKLRQLERTMTKDVLGLVASPKKESPASAKDRGRTRPLSTSTASLSSAQQSSSRSQQSLSSLSSRSPPGSIPSIPSSPPSRPPLGHWRSHPDTRLQRSYTQESSPSPSSPRVASPIPRHLSPPGKSSSPPTISGGRAFGQTHARGVVGTSGRTGGTGWKKDVGAGARANGRVSGQASEASSYSDLSDASVSASALESALMSNIKGGVSRFSSIARSSNLAGRRGVR